MTHVGKSARLLQVVAMCFALVSTAYSQEKTKSKPKQPIVAADGVGMTRLEAPDDYATNASIAHFSADGKQFVVVLRKGNLEQNTNDFSILLYQSAAVLRSPKPDVLLKMSSSSNRDATAKVRWLADDETLVFLAENPGELSQIYTFNVTSRVLRKLTNHLTAITNFDITGDGHHIVYIADPPKQKTAETDYSSSKEIVVAAQDLVELLTGSYSQPQQMFWQARGDSPRPVPFGAGYSFGWALSISPNGRYVVLRALGQDIPSEWANYQDADVQYVLAGNHRKGTWSPLEQYFVVDTMNMSFAPLVSAPLIGSEPIYWAENGSSVFLTSYLPLDVVDPAERKAREQNKFPIEVKLPSREYRKVTSEDFPIGKPESPPIELRVDQDLNTPPKIYVYDPKTQEKALLLELNPKLSELNFGAVKTMEWKVDGVELIAGLYLPPDYVLGKRYPLVIQTHGFEPGEFSMDGRAEWGSAFAARPLAAKGTVVLQFAHFKDHSQIDRVENDKSLGATVGESAAHFMVHAIDAAIDRLDKEGLVAPNRVGISGFSRWACFGGYILTHSKYRFAAASLVDGVSCGYFERIALPEIGYDVDNLMGGAPPFGEGLKLWMKNSPGFNLDKVQTPIQLATFGKGSVLSAWEWYVGLSIEKKPVDFLNIPDAIHIGVKPSERVRAQERMLDWFAFWLKGEEDPNPAKTEQYARWRDLRKLQEQNEAKTQAAPAN